MYALFKESVPIPVRRAVGGAETLCARSTSCRNPNFRCRRRSELTGRRPQMGERPFSRKEANPMLQRMEAVVLFYSPSDLGLGDRRAR